MTFNTDYNLSQLFPYTRLRNFHPYTRTDSGHFKKESRILIENQLTWLEKPLRVQYSTTGHYISDCTMNNVGTRLQFGET